MYKCLFLRLRKLSLKISISQNFTQMNSKQSKPNLVISENLKYIWQYHNLASGGHANRFIFHGRFRSCCMGRTARVHLHVYRLRCRTRQRLEVPLPCLQKRRRSVPYVMLRYPEWNFAANDPQCKKQKHLRL